MLTDNDDDFFFEEDKINQKDNVTAPLLLVDVEEEKAKDEFPISTAKGDSINIPSINEDEVIADINDESSDANIKALDLEIDFETAVVGSNGPISEKPSEFYRQKFELDRLGMHVTTCKVIITKDDSNLIGISIGGGAPLCPCLYIVQVFDNTPAALEGSLQSGDELLAVNNTSVKGKTKVEVAKMIQACGKEVAIHYNKLHADPEQGKSLDIILKKLKHRIVDQMSSSTADTLGLSRAILCNDSLVKRLEELQGTEIMYKGMVDHIKRVFKAYLDLMSSYKDFGDCFAEISAKEPQQRASETFRLFGEFHRNLEKDGMKIIKDLKPVLNDLGTYLHKAIPDTKMTVKRYADAKFTYLSYCLKVKEMDDEEHQFAALQESLYRVETGNYEYRLILRCRQDARLKFAKLRTDVLEKMELLEAKHASELSNQLGAVLSCLGKLSQSIMDRIEGIPELFPIEVDFKDTAFEYKTSPLQTREYHDEPDETDGQNIDTDEVAGGRAGSADTVVQSGAIVSQEIICGLEAVEEPAPIITIRSEQESKRTEDDSLLLLDPLDSTEQPCSSSKANTIKTTDLLDSIPSTSKQAALAATGLASSSFNLPSQSSKPNIDVGATGGAIDPSPAPSATSKDVIDETVQLLKDLGLFDVNLSVKPKDPMDEIQKQNGSFDFDLFLNQSAPSTSNQRDLMSSNASETDLLLQ